MKTRNFLLSLAFAVFALAGCVKDEVYLGPPTMSNLTITPQAPSSTDNVTVSVKVVDLQGVSNVKLHYKIGEAALVSVDMTAQAADIYTAQIPAQETGVVVNYYIEATNVDSKISYHPVGAPETTATYTVGAPSIVMNEVYSRGTVEEPDWVEIYNNSDVQVDISGYKIYDSGGQSGAKEKKLIPEGTILAPRGFYVIVVDDGSATGFGLSSGGEEIWFESASGSLVDNVAFPAIVDETTSYGRMPDGSSTWQILATITKGTANDDTPGPVQSVIKLNELYSNGSVFNPDWVEVYNTSSEQVDISGFKVYDSGGQAGSKPKKEFPAGTIIPANGFIVIVVDAEDESGFGLSSSGEKVWLENTASEVIDSVEFPALTAFESYGRFADGVATWKILGTVTPGAANVDAVYSSIVINEVFSNGTTEAPDWVEIHNTSAESIDISGYKIYDGGGQAGSKPKKVFPAGSIVPAGGYLVIVVDTEDESGFGLSSGGEQLWLENAAEAVIDTVVFPALTETQSFGRIPDGTYNLQILETVTQGTSNTPGK